MLVAILLPGLVFAAVRSGLRGYLLDDVTPGTRVAQALLAGVVFDLFYVIALGPQLVNRVGTPDFQNPREVALIVAVLGVITPAAVAYLLFGRPFHWKFYIVPIATSRYSRTPSAWDFKLPHAGGAFVRIHLPDGSLIGGWCGSNSFVSTYPHSRDIYLESQWELSPSGEFKDKMPNTGGVWTSVPDGAIITFTKTTTTEEPNNGRPQAV
ncbi:hypothetical protein EDD31_0742 [Bogoriella caseilytica]|uniref:Uncharacterized protein n=1 Tax=Bogoriella caseilytica TaxID=56055 RepID=A0A3N2BAV5_9MICO|nr:hypothetical protein EDD31_0742 [Bogoriella caseilytica]